MKAHFPILVLLLLLLFAASDLFASTRTVTKTADTNDGVCDADCSLREAITAVNDNGQWLDRISFDTVVFGTVQVINLQSALPNINSAVYIDGPGAHRLTVRRGDNTRSDFSVFCALSNLSNVSISDMTISNGRAPYGGGGIYSQSNLTLTNVHVWGNYASRIGGGVFVSLANASFTNCTFSANTASSLWGGAIALEGEFGTAWRMVNSTVSGNFTNGNGGGISVTTFGGEATLDVVSSTIANNIAPDGGGGLVVLGDISQSSLATATLRNTIITDNFPNNLRTVGFQGPAAIVSEGFNLTNDDGGGFLHGTGDKINAFAGLATLSNNGGTTPTHALRFGSSALDAGNNAGSGTITDQRGSQRTVDLASIPNAADGTDIGAYESQASPFPVAFDYDGDRRSDISVFRPSVGNWYLQRSFEDFLQFHFGLPNDRITPADFDGDGKTDIAVFRPSTRSWYVLNSRDWTISHYIFGLAEDIPTPADYDGDGGADLSVFRASNGYWYRKNSGDGSFVAIHFGASEDKPTAGDFDGDGRADIAVFRPSTATWYRIDSSNGSIQSELYGFGTDVTVPADYDGDGKTDLAVYRAANINLWYIRNSATNTMKVHYFGLPTDIPVPADYDGDGKADICIFRPSGGYWYRLNSLDGSFTAFQFGTNGDKPTQTAFRY